MQENVIFSTRMWRIAVDIVVLWAEQQFYVA